MAQLVQAATLPLETSAVRARIRATKLPERDALMLLLLVDISEKLSILLERMDSDDEIGS